MSESVLAMSMSALRRMAKLVRNVNVVNFLAYLAHRFYDGVGAFPSGGRLVDGQYLIASNGREFALSPGAYWFSYLHGVVFVLVLFATAVFVTWLVRQQRMLELNSGE
jgi:hypothetical protein